METIIILLWQRSCWKYKSLNKRNLVWHVLNWFTHKHTSCMWNMHLTDTHIHKAGLICFICAYYLFYFPFDSHRVGVGEFHIVYLVSGHKYMSQQTLPSTVKDKACSVTSLTGDVSRAATCFQISVQQCDRPFHRLWSAKWWKWFER